MSSLFVLVVPFMTFVLCLFVPPHIIYWCLRKTVLMIVPFSGYLPSLILIYCSALRNIASMVIHYDRTIYSFPIAQLDFEDIQHTNIHDRQYRVLSIDTSTSIDTMQ